MKFPYTIPMNTHKLFQCNMHVFIFDFLNVNMNKRKYEHIINQSFIRTKTFMIVQILPNKLMTPQGKDPLS